MKTKISHFNVNILLISLCFLAVASLLRLGLILLEIGAFPIDSIFVMLGLGFINDLMTLFYFLIPFIAILFVAPNIGFKYKAPRLFFSFLICSVALFFLFFVSMGEYLFWNEFQSRFDFIAVDYLVYTAEVIGNIKETYNIPLILFVIGISSVLVSLVITYFNRATILQAPLISYKRKLLVLPLFLVLFLGNFYVLPEVKPSLSENRVIDELSKNGLYELFSAFRNNELDYYKHYSTLPINEMYQQLESNLGLQKSEIGNENIKLLVRNVKSKNPLSKKNVVVILVESLGANFLTRFGNTNQITPYLDRLAEQSLSFENLYATGTRTVRGLEAVALSMPPTPGFSILKRPNNEKLNGIHNVLKKYGYSYDFIYGGYGYFDNMNYFFESNGYGIYDRADIPEEEIIFGNVWGVSDEDLLNYSLKNIDASYKKNKPFFKLILTTSNHRPYSYPDGRIDIPSKSGRDGAVKYTDYAIGKFIENAKSKKWFEDTIFLIMADHSADGRGTVSIPFSTYHIPALIYAPGFVKAEALTAFASQIDVIPTLFDMLGFDYVSPFIGASLFDNANSQELAFVGTYQNVGCFSGSKNSFSSLGTKRLEENFLFERSTKQLVKETVYDEPFLAFCKALYQYSSLIWKDGLMKSQSEVKQ